MAYKILFTEDSLRDLEGILNSIRADKPEASERFGTALLNHVDLLENFPKLGVHVHERSGVRKILHSPVRIYYRVHEKRKVIEILHFWHVARQNPVK